MTDCLFCRIALGEVPADIVYSDEDVLALRDIQPQAPVHLLVIPRRHVVSYTNAGEEDRLLFGRIAQVAARVAAEHGIAETGYRCVVNSGEDANQTVRHLHLHVLGGRPMGWPPG